MSEPGGEKKKEKKKIEKEKRKCATVGISEIPPFPKKVTSD